MLLLFHVKQIYLFLLIQMLAMITSPIVIAVPAPARKAPTIIAPIIFANITAAIVRMAIVVAVVIIFLRVRFFISYSVGLLFCARETTPMVYSLVIPI